MRGRLLWWERKEEVLVVMALKSKVKVVRREGLPYCCVEYAGLL